MDERILFVDDDANILDAYQRKLQHVLHVRTALGPHAGLREIQEKGPFAVVVADMNMPLMNGVEFLKNVRELTPNSVRMMLTGNSDIKTAMDAVNEGCVFRFLTKPCPSKLMGDSLAAAIKQYRLITAEREILEGTLKGTAELLAEIISWVSPETFGRAVQLRNAARAIAVKLGTVDLWEIELAATLCQIGMLALPAELLREIFDGVLLRDEDKAALESVPATGYELLERIPRLENVARIVLYQNKRFDGSGFPHDTMAGADIPVGSRIIKVAADFHELRASGKTRHEALEILTAREGWYDPDVLSALGVEARTKDAPSGAGQVLSVSFKDLPAGVTLAAPIVTVDGRKLVSSGNIITDAFLVRLRKYAETSGIVEPIEVIIHK